MSNTKKIALMSTLVLLLAVTAIFNFVLAGSNGSSKVDGSASVQVNYFTSYRAERSSKRSEEFIQLDSVISAYAQDSEDPYEAIETWRTVDEEHSVVRVGTALADALTAMGYKVTHDTTDHEQDALSSAYERSLTTLKRYEEGFDLRIDLHRDAYVDGLEERFTGPDGTQYAQLMLLVGRGDGYSDAERPPYEENLAFAQRLTNIINEQLPGLCRNVTVKKGRYNQHVDERCILVEVGHNLNTLHEALASVPTLAKGIDTVLREWKR